MADPIAVEFDLEPVALVSLLERKNEKIAQVAFVALFILFVVLEIALRNGVAAVGFFVFAAVFTVGMLRLPKLRQSMALRLAGQTEVVFSDEGMEFKGANVAERVPWARFQRVADRPGLWAFQTKAPVATFLVPKSAVPVAIREQFTAQLIDWSGAAYKFRRR